MKHLTRIAGRLFDTPLLMQEQKLDTIVSVLSPRLFGESLSEEDAIAVAKQINPEAAVTSTVAGRDSKPYVVTPDGIAVLGVDGPLVRSASWIDAMCGITSYENIRSQFRDALNDDSITGIMFAIDSPGGECSGLFDLADEIAAARSAKTIWACADGSAFSAAYAIACCTSRLWVSRTSGVGSIGVIMLHCDQSELDKKVGLKYTAIHAGKKKTDLSPHSPLSKQAEEGVQDEIDRLYDMFTSLVATNRDMSVKAVKATEAGLYWGENGVNSGLADEVGTLEDALAAMASAIAGPAKAPAMAASVTMPSSTAKEPLEMAKTNAATDDAVNPTAANAADDEEDKIGKGKKGKAKADDEADMTAPDDEDDEDDDDEEEEEEPEPAPKKKAKKKASASVSGIAALSPAIDPTAMAIAEMCALADQPQLTAVMMKKAAKGATLSEIREHLQKARVEQQDVAPLTSLMGRQTAGAGISFAQLKAQAEQNARTNRGTTKAQELSRLLKAHPEAYEHYLEVEQPAIQAQMAKQLPMYRRRLMGLGA